MSELDVLRAGITINLAECRALLGFIEVTAPVTVPILVRSATVGKGVPEAVTNTITDLLLLKLREVSPIVRTALDEAEYYSSCMGSPDALRDAAQSIRSKVVAPAQELAPSVVLGRLPSTMDSNWRDGKASERYRSAVDGRDTALARIESLASPIISALEDLADAIPQFFIQLAAFVSGAVVALLGLAVAFSTAETGYGAIAGFLAAIAGVLTTVIAGLQYKLGTEQTIQRVTRQLSGETPGWPKVLP